MKSILFAAAVAALLLPSVAQAQIPRLMAGAGLSTPTGAFSDDAENGYHGRLGLQLGAPMSPLAARIEGEYHSFDQMEGLPKISILNGALSAVLSLEGVGLTPYFLAGVGRYRVDADAEGLEPVTDTGFHGGFGVNIGAIGLGGFAEFRVVQISTAGNNIRYFPLSVGFRL